MNVGRLLIRGARTARRVLYRRSEAICAVGASAFLVKFGFDMWNEVPEIQSILSDKKKEYKSVRENDSATKKEVIMETGKELLPHIAKPAGDFILSLAFICGGSFISARKLAALEVAYSMSEETVHAYEDKLDDIVGKKKADEVREAVAQERVSNFQGNGIVETGHGDQLMFMMSTGTWFRSSPDYVRLIFSRVNERLADYEEVELNDVLDDLGLDRCKLAGMVGWNASDGERAEVDLRNTGMYVDRVSGKEEAAIFVSSNELPLKNVYGDLDWHRRY